MSTKIELTLEQSQQGVSNDVLESTHIEDGNPARANVKQALGRYIHGLVLEIRGMVRVTGPSMIQSAILRARAMTDDEVRTRSCLKVVIKGKEEVSQVSKQGMYECESPDHFHNTCPRLNRALGQMQNNPNQVLAIDGNNLNRGNNGNLARVCAFVMGTNKADQDPNVMTAEYRFFPQNIFTFSWNIHMFILNVFPMEYRFFPQNIFTFMWNIYRLFFSRNTENVIVAGADNCPPMLEKSMYNSWVYHQMCTILSTFTLLLKKFRIESNYLWKAHNCHCKNVSLINDMNMIGMSMQKLQVNTKFVNNLQPEWIKFVTDVKLARDMHESNFDHLYVHLKKHEVHANEIKMMRERFPDPLALHYQAPAVQQQPQVVYLQLDSRLVVPSFLPGDDPIASLNKAMAFISTLIFLRYLTTNNQLRTSSNLRNQSTVQDGMVTMQQVQGRQSQSFIGNGSQSNDTRTGCNRNVGTNAANQTRVICCYNCRGEGHMARQCTQTKRTRNTDWFKEKILLVQAHELGVVLDKEQLAFLVDPGVAQGYETQTTLPINVSF
nr:reverse transcriptase domain-containing protein [Tanacetum cinerariifolium]